MFTRIVFLLIIYSCFFRHSFAKEVRMNWTELPSFSTKPLFIIGIEAKNNFWITDKKEFVYQWNGKKWREFIFPDHETILAVEYYYSKKDEILFAVTNKTYQTSYYRFANRQWKKIPFAIDSRTQNITSTTDSCLYIWGDWGSLIRVKNNRWEKIEIPIKNHLVAFTEIDRDQYLISVRSEGIFRLSGSTFSRISIPERYRGNIIRFIKSNSKIFALSSHRHVLQFEGNTFIESLVPADEISDFYAEKHFGFSRLPYSQNEWNTLYFEIPRNLRVINHAVIDSGTVVVTTETGKIFIGERTNSGYFVDVTNAYNIPMNPEYPFLTIQSSDIDNDGFVDFVAVNKQKKNSAVIYANVQNAPFIQESKMLKGINTEHFITACLADMNGDSSPDIVIARSEPSGIVIEFYEQERGNHFYPTETVTTQQLHNAQRLTSMHSFDYDIDGDNDIVLTFYHNDQMQKGFVIVLNNSWWGRSFTVDTSLISLTRGWNTGISFTNLYGSSIPEMFVHNRWGENSMLEFTTQGWRSASLHQYPAVRRSKIQHIVFADVDRDGDTDAVLLSDSTGIQLLSNINGEELKKEDRTIFPSELNLRNIQWQRIVSADINCDSFPDIILSTLECNYLLINEKGMKFIDMTKEYKFTEPILHSMVVHDIDNDGDMDIFGYNNERSVLFENTTDPLEVKAAGLSEEFSVKNVGFTSMVTSVPGMVFRFFIRVEIQLYLAVIVINVLLILYGLHIGKSRFQWETNAQLWFVSGTMFLFWIVSAFTYSNAFFQKYILPSAMVILAIAILLILYALVRKKILQQESKKALQHQLLEAVVEFMHGQWAIKNLNGLMLYSSDMAEMRTPEASMLEQLNQRKTMFVDATIPRLKIMCTLALETGIHSAIARDIQERLEQIQSILSSNSWTEHTQLSSVSVALKSLKSMISNFRDNVLNEYSCILNNVLQQVLLVVKNEYHSHSNISMHTESLKGSGKVLIKSYELADILDNCIQNGIRAVLRPRIPNISVLVYRDTPKICIDIVDNGSGVVKENWEKIFQKGYSEHHSTGLGLALARETLDKYGGRIFVKQSGLKEGTTVTIELNEVP